MAATRASRATLPPQARGLPLVGSVLDVSRDMRSFLTEQYVELGPVFRLRLAHRRFTVLAGAEANEFLNNEGRHSMSNSEIMDSAVHQVGAKTTLINVDGTDHERLRDISRDAYSLSYFKENIAKVAEITRREVSDWSQDKPVTGLYAMQRITTDQLGTLMSGISPHDYLDDLIVYVRTLLLVRVAHLRPPVVLRMPRFRRVSKRVDEMFAHVMAAHEPATARTGCPHDLMDSTIAAAHSDPDIVTSDDFKATLLTPFFAGLDPVSGACALMLYALLKHPDVLERVVEEADALFADGVPDEAALRRLDVTNRATLETLRMYPPVPSLPRTTAESFDFGGYTIAAAEPVIMATTVPHYLPELFPNPERFDIDRYTPERMEHLQPGAFAPYGVGPHTCLGTEFANLQVALTVATILHSAELALDPPDYDLEFKYAPMFVPASSLKFRVVRRRNQ